MKYVVLIPTQLIKLIIGRDNAAFSEQEARDEGLTPVIQEKKGKLQPFYISYKICSLLFVGWGDPGFQKQLAISPKVGSAP